MADTNINTGVPIRWESGGELDITDGATTYDVKQVQQGSVELEPGGYQPIPYHDRNELQPPLEGNERPSRIRFVLQLTSFQAASLYGYLTARDATSNKMKLFSIAVKWADYKGAATGQSATFANCYMETPPRIRTGVELDTIEFEMMSNEVFAVCATY